MLGYNARYRKSGPPLKDRTLPRRIKRWLLLAKDHQEEIDLLLAYSRETESIEDKRTG